MESANQTSHEATVPICLPAGPYPWHKAAKLSRRHKGIRQELLRLHAELVAALIARYGRSPTLAESQIVAAVVRHEGISRLAEERLAKDPGMAVADLNALLGRIGSATDNARRAIAALKLDASEQDVFDSLYGPQAVAAEQEAAAPGNQRLGRGTR